MTVRDIFYNDCCEDNVCEECGCRVPQGYSLCRWCWQLDNGPDRDEGDIL